MFRPTVWVIGAIALVGSLACQAEDPSKPTHQGVVVRSDRTADRAGPVSLDGQALGPSEGAPEVIVLSDPKPAEPAAPRPRREKAPGRKIIYETVVVYPSEPAPSVEPEAEPAPVAEPTPEPEPAPAPEPVPVEVARAPETQPSSGPESSPEGDSSRVEDALVGAAIGAAIGGVVGGGEGAARGGVAGAIGGAVGGRTGAILGGILGAGGGRGGDPVCRPIRR